MAIQIPDLAHFDGAGQEHGNQKRTRHVKTSNPHLAQRRRTYLPNFRLYASCQTVTGSWL